jgi:tripartite-type tricarboxylate transporter receptor subunit TctC
MLKTVMKFALVPAMLAALSLHASADEYPSKPINVMVPFSAGAISDGVARMVCDRAGKLLNANFVITNKAGANGSIGAHEVAKSAADGYTIIVSSNSAHAADKYLYKSLAYDPVKDFVPITGMTQNPHLVVVRADLPVKTMKEFLDYAKAHPGKLTWGTGNSGSLANGSLLTAKGGFKAVKASYKSQPQAVVDLLAGRIDFMTVDYFNVSEHLAAGKLRAIGVTSTHRLAALPDVPTVAETIPGYEVVGWIAAFAPAHTPPEVIAKLNKAFTEVLRSKEIKDYMESRGMLPFPTTPEELGKFQVQQVDQWAEMLKLAGVERQ